MPDTNLGAAPATLELGKEYPPPGEAEAIEKLRGLHLKVQGLHPGKRGEHPKHHAGLWATFTVESNIPAQMRVGIFAEPRAFKAFLRFSNGRNFDDRVSDVHAIAIKVLIPGDAQAPVQQDFILADHPVFFAEDVQRTLEFLIASVTGTTPDQLAKTSYPKLIGFTNVPQISPLAMTYWSQTPYRLGTVAVKYVAFPSAGQDLPKAVLNDSPDCLKEVMAEQLAPQAPPVRFEFCVNPQTDAAAMPVENPTIEWDSQPVKLATIEIQPQHFDTPERMTFVENLTWTPWHALPEHTPIGGVNRARRMVYEDSQALRHKINSVETPVITGNENF